VNELAYWDLVGALTLEIDQLRSRLARSTMTPTVSTDTTRADLRAAIHQILADEVPDDEALRVQRAALVQALVREIAITVDQTGVRVTCSTSIPYGATAALPPVRRLPQPRAD